MISLLNSLGHKSLALLAVLIVCLLPAASQAETITIKNTTNGTVVILVAWQVKNQVKGPVQYKLKPGESTPGITLPGNKKITIVDAAMPGRILFSDVIPAGTDDQDLNIIMEGKGADRKMKLVPKDP